MSEKTFNKSHLNFRTIVYQKLSVVNTEFIAFLLLLFLCFQPLYSIVYRANNVTELVALYLSKATVVRLIGFLGLLNAAVDFYKRCYLFGREAALKAFIGNIWTGLFAIVLLLALISCFTSKNPYISFNGDPYRYEGYVSYVAYAGIFSSASLIASEKRKTWILRTFVYVSAFLAFITIIKELTGSRILMYAGSMVLPYSGTFVNSNHYGYYLCMAIILSLGLYMKQDEWYHKLAYCSILAINTFVLLMNGSYGPYLATTVAIVVTLVFYVIRNGIKKCWPASIPLAVFILLSVFVNSGVMLKEFGKMFSEVSRIFKAFGIGIETGDMDSALDGVNGGSNRFRIWVATVKVIRDYPVFGCGTDYVHRILPDYGIGIEMPHNEYLQITANCGIPAGLTYVTALVWFFVRNMRNLKKLSSATIIAGTAVTVYAISAFFGVGLTITVCYMFLFMGLTNSWHSERRKEELIKTHTGMRFSEKSKNETVV